MFTTSLRIAAACLVVASVAATSADAQHRGGRGGGGGGGSIGRSIGHSAPSFRSAAPSIRSAPRMHFSAPAARHSVTPRSLKLANPNRSVTTSRSATSLKTSPNVSQKLATSTPKLTRNNRSAAIQSSVLRNRSFVGSSKASANFHGQLASKRIGNPQWARFGRHRHFFVIGWLGPLFWPYFYDDYLDYIYWPYAYDTFWPYAYDDVYFSVFGPYAYAGGNVYASAPAYREGRRVLRVPAGGVAQVCSLDASTLTDWPVERIIEKIDLNDQQRGLLDDFKNATAKAVEEMKSACPTDLPGTPTARLAAMRARIESMLTALSTIRPTLERFYTSLSDEQKARFDAIPDEPRRSRAAARTDASQVCNTQAAGRFPVERIRSALAPSQDQETALDALEETSRRAAERLKADCEGDQNLTAPGRVAAMERRLKSTREALDSVQPALGRFYGSLSDEQKARFNRLTRQS